MDYVQKNANHFSEEHAALYDNEGTFAIGKGIAWNILTYGNELLKPAESKDTVNPIWKNARVLDFACGTGIVSQVRSLLLLIQSPANIFIEYCSSC